MAKDDEKVEIIDTEIKEKIGFASLLYDRLYTIARAFDSEDKHRIIESLYTCFDDISPYLDRKMNNRLIKKIEGLDDIHDKKEFKKEAHKVHRHLLKILKRRKMLIKEVPVAIG